MVTSTTLILAGGGPRSLVATAAALTELRPAQVHLLHLSDHRSNARTRLEYAHRQAQHFQIRSFIELELPRFKTTRDARTMGDPPTTPLFHAQLLLLGLGQAIELSAERLVWPVQGRTDLDSAARLTEQTLLVEHLAQLEQRQLPRIDMPLLELTDRQVVELGGQLQAPWELAWSCLLHGDQPCRVCQACRARQAAFNAAGILDPADPLRPALK